MDRSDDREPTLALDRLVAGMDTGREVLGRDLNWQLHNGLDYYVKHTRPDLAVFDLPDTLLSFPFLVSRNAELGRTVLLTDGSAAMVRQLYGGLYDLERDPRVPVPTLAERVATLAPGTPYVLSIIEAYPEAPIDRADLAEAAKRLGLGTGDRAGGPLRHRRRPSRSSRRSCAGERGRPSAWRPISPASRWTSGSTAGCRPTRFAGWDSATSS